MLRNRPHRTRQDRFVGDDEGLRTTRNTSSLNDSNHSQPLNPKPPAQTHTSIGMYCECVIGIRVGQVGHPLLLDEGALTGQALQNPPDDLRSWVGGRLTCRRSAAGQQRRGATLLDSPLHWLFGRHTRVHLMMSSACIKTDWGIATPIVFAVLRFTTNSNLVGCSMGKSPGFMPLRILSTYPAERRNKSA